MAKKITIAVLIAIVLIGGGVWYYYSQLHHAKIEKILSRPGEFSGKTVTVEGDVTERTAFFGAVKFFKIRDKTGEIIVVTKGNAFPDVKSKVRVKGTVDQAFSMGDEKLVVFAAESIEEEGEKK